MSRCRPLSPLSSRNYGSRRIPFRFSHEGSPTDASSSVLTAVCVYRATRLLLRRLHCLPPVIFSCVFCGRRVHVPRHQYEFLLFFFSLRHYDIFISYNISAFPHERPAHILFFVTPQQCSLYRGNARIHAKTRLFHEKYNLVEDIAENIENEIFCLKCVYA